MISPDRFVYRPQRKKGSEVYDGTPCPTKRAYDVLGDEGVEALHKIMQVMTETRKKMFGDGKAEYFGFTKDEIFFDTEVQTAFSLSKHIATYKENHELEDAPFPELLEKDNIYIVNETRRPFLGKEDPKQLGKRAFRNRMNEWLAGDRYPSQSDQPTYHEKLEQAMAAVKFLKENDIHMLIKALEK